MSAEIVKSNGDIERRSFGETTIERRRETATVAAAAQATASIQARYLVARGNPRSFDDVRIRMLRNCGRVGFADKALYAKPQGKKKVDGRWIENLIEGLSARFAEDAMRTMGNMSQSTNTIYDDEDKRIVNVSVTDLETNATLDKEITVIKTVERQSAGERVVIAQRQNTGGQTVYIVACTDDELLQKENAMVSKAARTLILKLLPADIAEDCLVEIRKTRANRDKADPEGARKAVADAFAVINVLPSDLKEYLGHDLAMCSPAELEELRGLYGAIREGEITFHEALKEKRGATPEGEPEAEGKAGAAIAKRVRQRAEKATPVQQPTPIEEAAAKAQAAGATEPAPPPAAESPAGEPTT
jgi:hypothetical protein